MDWLTRETLGDGPAAQLPTPVWMWLTLSPPSKGVARAPLPDGTLVLNADQEQPLASIDDRRAEADAIAIWLETR